MNFCAKFSYWILYIFKLKRLSKLLFNQLANIQINIDLENRKRKIEKALSIYTYKEKQILLH